MRVTTRHSEIREPFQFLPSCERDQAPAGSHSGPATPLSALSFSSGDLAALPNAEPGQYRSAAGVLLQCCCSAGVVPIRQHFPERGRENTGLFRMVIPRQVAPR